MTTRVHSVSNAGGTAFLERGERAVLRAAVGVLVFVALLFGASAAHAVSICFEDPGEQLGSTGIGGTPTTGFTIVIRVDIGLSPSPERCFRISADFDDPCFDKEFLDPCIVFGLLGLCALPNEDEETLTCVPIPPRFPREKPRPPEPPPEQCTASLDTDGDGICADNCPVTPNPNQEDSDFDQIGDACDTLSLTAFNPAVPGDVSFGLPGTGLIQNGMITTNVDVLAALANPMAVTGLAADGATKVVLKAEPPQPGVVTFELEPDRLGGIGGLSALGQSTLQNRIEVRAQRLATGRLVAFAVLTAPEAFARVANDIPLRSRPVVISARLAPDNSTAAVQPVSLPLQITRPPIVLLHGIFGGDTTFDGNPLLTDGRFFVFEADYEETNDRAFSVNRDITQREIIRARFRFQVLRGIVAAQTDVVGHSMGGLLARLHAANAGGTYFREDNFRRGDIRRLITLDTPHLGSPVADCVTDILGSQSLASRAADLLARSVGMCPSCGAVEDLRVNGDAIRALPALTGVPVHALFGAGGSDFIAASGQSTGQPALDRLWPFLGILRSFGVRLDTLFEGDEHDLVVGAMSQRGRLPVPATTRFGAFDPLPVAPLTSLPGTHTTVPNEARVGTRIATLVDADPGSLLFADGLPRADPTPITPCTFSPPPGASIPNGISLRGPAGAVFAGQRVDVDVIPASGSGFRPNSVLVMSPFGSSQLTQPKPDGSFSAALELPAKMIGVIPLAALASDAQGNFATNQIELVAGTSAALVDLRIAPEVLLLSGLDPEQRLSVFGQFSDGIERKLAASVHGLQFSSDTSAVRVGADGLVTAVAAGTASITVTGGAFSKTVQAIAANLDVSAIAVTVSNPRAGSVEAPRVARLGSEIRAQARPNTGYFFRAFVIERAGAPIERRFQQEITLIAERGLSLTAEFRPLGDVNDDDRVDAGDVLRLLAAAKGHAVALSGPADLAPWRAAGPEPNGVVDIADVMIAQQIARGLRKF